MLDGAAALEPGPNETFHLRDDKSSTAWLSFHDVVNNRSQRMKFSGEDLWRVSAM